MLFLLGSHSIPPALLQVGGQYKKGGLGYKQEEQLLIEQEDKWLKELFHFPGHKGFKRKVVLKDPVS